MDKSIQIAKSVLAKMFHISDKHFEKHTDRSASVAEARRFLVYFLVKELKIRYNHVKRFVPALTNHATAIYHFRKMEELMDVEWQTAKSYRLFRDKMEKEGHIHLVEDYHQAIDELTLIKEKIKNLKKLV